ncbi:hypothetical protein BT67DRAFT_443651 [Trichocladium antarcticum]|uniref:Uncharacterized protein n=1 Tax=Trichocladium antarcticum TaxID=1450529 RepID=A0AAN6ZB14_9PEZI|nr:hypothetical protein BT67DRAFT_443651 [Trichocladium antarcticum]
MASWEDKHQYWRKPQPTHWQTVMAGRDGAASNPSVTVYRAKVPGPHGSILDPSRRVKFQQKPHHGRDLPPHLFPADPELMTGDEQEKELIVVVKRGSGVNYEEKKDSPFIHSDIRQDLPEMTWKQIRALCIDNQSDGEDEEDNQFDGEDEEDNQFDGEDEEAGRPHSDKEDVPAEADVYKDVDEYSWTSLHFIPNIWFPELAVPTIG